MSNRSKEFASNTLILFFGTFCTKITQFLLLPIYTNILTTTEYGEFELFNTIISLLLPIASLQIEQGVFRFLVSRRTNTNAQQQILSSSFFFIIITNLCWILLFSLLSPIINYRYKWLLIINLCTNNIYNYCLQIARGLGDNKRYSFSNILTTLITISFNIFFLLSLHFNVTGLIYASIIGYALGTIYLFLKLKILNSISTKHVEKGAIQALLKYSLPMVPNSLSWWIFSSSDRLIVSWLLGVASTGILSIAYKFSNISALVYSVFNLSITESVSIHIADQDFQQYYNNIFSAIAKLFTAFASTLLAFMPIIFIMLVGKNFDEAYNLIPIAASAALLQVMVELLGTVYVAKNNTLSIAATSIVAAFINIITNILLIPLIGIYAAVISTVIAYLVLFIYRFINVNKTYFTVKIAKEVILYFIFGIMLISILYYTQSLILITLGMPISAILAILFNIHNIKFISSFIRGKISKIKN